MSNPNQPVLDFLATRRSRAARTLQAPVPSRDELLELLTLASRTPDHGKLEPWRFIVIEKDAMERLANLAENRGLALGKEPARAAMARGQYDRGNLAVAVIECRRAHDTIPDVEQTYTVGAVCLALLNAAHAAGWGANWLSGWASHDREFAQEGFGLEDHERIAGIIHIGTETAIPAERPRPDVKAMTTWL